MYLQTFSNNKELSLMPTEMPSSFLTYQRVCNKSRTKGGTCGVEYTALPGHMCSLQFYDWVLCSFPCFSV